MKVALYPGSFDPFTYGHIDIIRRTSKLFDKVIVGVYDTPEKKLMFTTGERVELGREAVRDLPDVEVKAFSGLMVEFARKEGVTTVVRGLRVNNDFEFEFDMAMINRKLAPEIELVCLLASPEYQFLSSSMLKEVARLGGDFSDLVPPFVARAVLAKV
ncbi:Phosphopantetheine adenylyltransferase [Dehalogenimonas formicexedens]|uniref:Phosphopantetheine adenylyltransferase n=1 Tax=Dehalogenimonas formicexedens TaxID=1839801 RepID=A0A1P8F5W6_9CHLR|nr:pantetheine-phosphate adenylyltransferase [Dehalogenimonas formicexedens]APV43825.1 Phosphopantetheine adenylyltransferase [Dehalogenimonas formicexedens]